MSEAHAYQGLLGSREYLCLYTDKCRLTFVDLAMNVHAWIFCHSLMCLGDVNIASSHLSHLQMYTSEQRKKERDMQRRFTSVLHACRGLRLANPGHSQDLDGWVMTFLTRCTVNNAM